ncbi:hypothetical protein Tsubulata_002325 [Turnera subulata]|uniref:Senescence regulator S40 n=1 Tax=Turnera subulata TaxID=218843 RepID=A0A9Q0JJT6_9ROSI|nr:hypothetical protein Tsubulata_002325 [Turnera subulata]
MDRRYLVRQSSGLSRSLRDGDFEEQDVWDVLKDRKYDSGRSTESSFPVPRNIPTASRMIPRGSSSSNYSSHEPRVLQQSAPVNVPDWSKICGKKSINTSRKGSSWLGGDDSDEDYGAIGNGGVDSDEEDEGDDSGFNDKMPPHEFIARRLASSQISSFSVLEGVGRKLKGRDLSKVRHAVLTKTGFLE